MWELVTSLYDSSGNLDFTREVETTTGARRDSDYDQASQNDWQLIQTFYDAQGRLDWQREDRDNGSYVIRDWDLANQNDWQLTQTLYDAQGRLDWQRENRDDGSFIDRDWDQANSDIWSGYTTVYDAQGRLDWQRENRDDGSFIDRDWDQANSSILSLYTYFYDSQGRLDWQREDRDDRSYVIRDWDQANQFSWSRKVFQFNAAGMIDYTWEYLDSGARVEVDYDAANQHNWSARATSVNSMNSSGSVIDVKVIRDEVASAVMASNVKWSVDASGKLQIAIRGVAVPGESPVPAIDPLAPPGDPYYLSAPSARLTTDQLLGPTGYDPYAPGRGVRVVYTSNGDPELRGELSADDLKYILKNFNNDVTSLVDGIKSSWNGVEDNVLHPVGDWVSRTWNRIFG
jgi:hypothetical protein